jgi:hypothetical protein
MKALGTVTYQGRETAIDTALTHLRRVRADPAEFVRPADYKGLPLDFSRLGLR